MRARTIHTSIQRVLFVGIAVVMIWCFHAMNIAPLVCTDITTGRVILMVLIGIRPEFAQRESGHINVGIAKQDGMKAFGVSAVRVGQSVTGTVVEICMGL